MQYLLINYLYYYVNNFKIKKEISKILVGKLLDAVEDSECNCFRCHVGNKHAWREVILNNS